MRVPNVTFLLSLALIVAAQQGVAAPKELRCKLLSASTKMDRWVDIDRVIIDPVAPRVELQDSSTMNDEYPQNWILEDGAGTYDDQLSIMDLDGRILGAAIRGPTPQAFFWTDEVLTWTFIDPTEEFVVKWFKWRCR